jgi:hypothetical protein
LRNVALERARENSGFVGTHVQQPLPIGRLLPGRCAIDEELARAVCTPIAKDAQLAGDLGDIEVLAVVRPARGRALRHERRKTLVDVDEIGMRLCIRRKRHE